MCLSILDQLRFDFVKLTREFLICFIQFYISIFYSILYFKIFFFIFVKIEMHFTNLWLPFNFSIWFGFGLMAYQPL